MYKIYIFIYLLHFFNNLFNFHLFLIFKYLSNLIYHNVKNHWNSINNEIIKHFWDNFQTYISIIHRFYKKKKLENEENRRKILVDLPSSKTNWSIRKRWKHDENVGYLFFNATSLPLFRAVFVFRPCLKYWKIKKE